MTEPETGFNPQELTRLAKQRAIELLEGGDLIGAIDSMVSDLSKDSTRPEMQKSMIAGMGMALRNDPGLDEQKVREFIEGFAE